jgi:hypothetical protein
MSYVVDQVCSVVSDASRSFCAPDVRRDQSLEVQDSLRGSRGFSVHSANVSKARERQDRMRTGNVHVNGQVDLHANERSNRLTIGQDVTASAPLQLMLRCTDAE